MWSDHMEQTRNRWMWVARNLEEKVVVDHGESQIRGSACAAAYESWEERAFAEDSAGRLGGCVWPPRSYPCSFCKREFRSAQALGGHMNVHRRDRARLKQSLSPADYDAPADCGSACADPPLFHKYGGGSTPCAGLAPPADLFPRVSAAAGARQYALFSPPCKSLPSSVSVLLELMPAEAGRRLLSSQELKLCSENSSPSDRNIDHDDDEDEDEEEVEEEEEEEEQRRHIGSIIKRRRTEIDFSAAAAIGEKVQSDQVLKQSSWPVEELDLELRLGQKRRLPVTIEL